MAGTDKQPEPSATTPDPPTDQQVGRIAAARLRIDRTRSQIVASRSRFRSVDLAFEFSGRDSATGGAVLAGAIAFRLFLWTLPASLLIVGLLGFNSSSAKSGATDVGIGNATAAAVGQAAEQAHRGRWVLVLVGLVLLVSVSRTLAVTLQTATALTWQEPVRKRGGYVQTAGVTMATMAVVFCLLAFTAWLRTRSSGLGIGITIIVAVVWAAMWWGISELLPHPQVPWWGLLPGAALVGVGMELMHLAVIFYLSPKITSSSALYGSLGTAATLLLGAYLLARLMLAGAGLNATVQLKRPEWTATPDQS